MGSKNVLRRVLGHLKDGKLLGTVQPSGRANVASAWTPDAIKYGALKYRSYNPSLTKEDFSNLYLSAVFTSKRPDVEDFELIKCRDPKFFQYQNQYIILFKDQNSTQRYLRATTLGRINNVRVKFYPVPSADRARTIYSNYVHNLLAAYDSSNTYFDLIRTKRSEKTSPCDVDIHALKLIADPLEQKSALVWNLPLEMKSIHIMDRFWFYDLKHCFKLYWDKNTGRTLYYVAFNDSQDCEKFQRNLHGSYLSDLPQKLLIQKLGPSIG